jgi:hypothetical protein
MADSQRDHLFISYATEDSAFSDWLARKLMSAGYRVWYDQLKLLGGESYPADIDVAIKERSFRLLALLSPASLVKPNPLKERTLALNISRERKIGFLIPLLVQPLRPAELDWMTSDLTHIPFHGDWASGFAALLERLRSSGAPCDPGATRSAICDWSAAQDRPVQREERLWTNLLPILEVPKILRGFELAEGTDRDRLALRWPYYWHGGLAWAFGAPDPSFGVRHGKPTEIHWPSFAEYRGMKVENAAHHLIRRSLLTHCIRKGAQAHPTQRAQVYFPQNLLPDGKLWYSGYAGRRTYVAVTGERAFFSRGEQVKNRYHLAVAFTPALRQYGQPVVQVRMGLHLRDEHGRDLDSKTAFRRQKRVRKTWWNHQWLCRLLAVSFWMADGEDTFNALDAGDARLIIGRLPLHTSTSYGIDEDALAPVQDDDDQAVVDDDESFGPEEG